MAIGGILDQTPVPGTPDLYKNEYLQDRAFVKSIETPLPKGTMIFQLPYVPYPESLPVNKMTDYEHFKGYLHSTHLRWSYGAPKGREADRWQQQVTSQPLDGFVNSLVFVGFGGLWLDRFGYADNGVQMVAQLNTILETTPVESENQRYVFWDLAKYTLKMKTQLSAEEWKQRTADAWLPMQWNIEWGEGFYNEEHNATDYWRWCGSEVYLYFHNRSAKPATITFSAEFVTPGAASASLKFEGGILNEEVMTQNGQYNYKKQLEIPPGRHKVAISTTAKQAETPQDPRKIFFGIYNYRLVMVAGQESK